MTSPKEDGGLGIQDSHLMNVTLLGKLVSSQITNKDSLWVKMLANNRIFDDEIWDINHAISNIHSLHQDMIVFYSDLIFVY